MRQTSPNPTKQPIMADPIEAQYRCRDCSTPWIVFRADPPDWVRCRFCVGGSARRIK